MASGSSSGLCWHGKSNGRSRVIDFGGQNLEGTMVGRTEQEVRWNALSMDVGKHVNEVITSDMQALVVEFDKEVKFDQEVPIVDV